MARATELGTALEHRWPRVGEAFLDGQVCEAQAAVIVGALDVLPDDLDPELRTAAEVEHRRLPDAAAQRLMIYLEAGARPAAPQAGCDVTGIAAVRANAKEHRSARWSPR